MFKLAFQDGMYKIRLVQLTIAVLHTGAVAYVFLWGGRERVCERVCVYVCERDRACVCVCFHMHVRSCVCLRMCLYVIVFTYVYICLYLRPFVGFVLQLTGVYEPVLPSVPLFVYIYLSLQLLCVRTCLSVFMFLTSFLRFYFAREEDSGCVTGVLFSPQSLGGSS